MERAPENMAGISKSGNRRSTCGVLFVHEGENWIRGSERCLLDLLDGLPRQRFHSVVWCNAEALAAEARARGVPASVRTPWEREEGRFLPEISLLRETIQLIRQQNIQIIHANAGYPLKWLIPVSKLLGLPVVLHVHIQPTEKDRHFRLMHQAAMVVGVAEASLAGFRQDGMPTQRMRVIHNSVNEDRLRQSGLDTPAWKPRLNTRPSVLVVGSLIVRKGVDTLLRATAIGRDRGHDWNLLLVGDGPERASLQALADVLNITDRVAFAGERNDIGRLLSQFQESLFVSAAHEEMLPLTVIEAMTSGLAIAVSDIPAHREALGPDASEYFTASDAESAAGLIADLVADPDQRRRIGLRARERARMGFSFAGYIAEFTKLYDQLIQTPRWRYSVLGGVVWPRSYTGWFKLGKTAWRPTAG